MDTNMMLVIGGLVIAILVLLFLRQKSKHKSHQPKAKTANTKKISRPEPKLTPVASKPKVDVKRINTQIDDLIATQQYAKAEGIINANLNQNPDLHDLYGRLLQIYQLQHDEFAIKQLFETLQRLNLDTLYRLLTLTHDQYLTDQQALVEQPSITQTSHTEQQPSSTDNSLSFEDLNHHLEIAPEKSTPHLSNSQHTSAAPTLEVEPPQAPASPHTTAHVIDFVTSRQVDTVLNNPSTPQHLPVDVSPKASDEPAIDTQVVVPSLEVDNRSPVFTPHAELTHRVENSLNFDVSATGDGDNAPTQTAAPTPAVPPFDLNIDKPASPATATASTAKVTTDNDFKLTLNCEQITTPLTPTSTQAEAQPLNFDVDEPSNLVFKLNNPNLALQPSAPTAQPVAEQAPSSRALASAETIGSSRLNFEAAVAIEAADTKSASSEQHKQINDPILLAFPQLLDVDPAAVDLELAAHYICLGQFEAARQLLNPYRADQQYAHQVNDLMQQIA